MQKLEQSLLISKMKYVNALKIQDDYICNTAFTAVQTLATVISLLKSNAQTILKMHFKDFKKHISVDGDYVLHFALAHAQ